jgi:hypothetical protein
LRTVRNIFLKNKSNEDDDQYFSDDDNPSCSLDYLDKAKNRYYYMNDSYNSTNKIILT